MGSDHSKEFSYRRSVGQTPPSLSQDEVDAIKTRRPKSRKALLKLMRATYPALANELEQHGVVPASVSEDAGIGRPADALPRIGIAISGGGWRAMTAGVAVMDELSRVGLVDTIEVASGLSGGSWFIQNWALGGIDRNVFHDSAQSNADATTAAHAHPWAFESHFDPTVHRYEGLINMLSKKVVHNSAQIPRLLHPFGKFADFVTRADGTFFRLLVLSSGGRSMISRYASFLDQQLLGWTSPEDREQLLLQNPAAASGPRKGIFPVLVVAAIDTLTNEPFEAQTPLAQRNKSNQKNVWTEFSTFGARSPNVEHGATQPIAQMHVTWDKRRLALTAGRLMAVCGSAFAADGEQVIESQPWLGKVAKFFGIHTDESDVIFKKAMTKTYVSLPKRGQGAHTPVPDMEKVLFGQLRDAGLDFNIPFPLMFKQSSGRTLDIVVAVDAGYAATGAKQLALAVEYGYIEIEGATVASLKAPFQPIGDRVRVFYPPIDKSTGERSGPIIVYVVVLNSTTTSKIVFSREEVIACTSFVRQTVRDQLVPEVVRCIRKYCLDHLVRQGNINAERRQELEKETGELSTYSTNDVAIDPSGALDQFREATHKALERLYRGDSSGTLSYNPLDVVQGVEHELLRTIPDKSRAACLQRVAELAAVADANNTAILELTSPVSDVDEALLKSGWIVATTIEEAVTYAFAHETLLDYALAVSALLELVLFVGAQQPKVPAPGISKVLKRDGNLLQPLAVQTPRVLDRMTIGDPSWRFVFTYLSMLVSTPDAGPFNLATILKNWLAESSTDVLRQHEAPGKLLAPIAALSRDQYVRFDVRENVRRELGISLMVESLCFLTIGDASCAADEALLDLWGPYFHADKSGRFSYFVLESLLFCARGVRCANIVSALLPKAKLFIKSVRGDRRLLAVALYCSSFRNGGNIELLKSSNMKGDSDENPAQHCTVMDACAVGNHNAVEMILAENVNGVPPMDAVRRAIHDKFPKCVDALINDDEVTKDFLLSVRDLLAPHGQEFDAQRTLLEKKLVLY
jgi:hypothetical protein